MPPPLLPPPRMALPTPSLLYIPQLYLKSQTLHSPWNLTDHTSRNWSLPSENSYNFSCIYFSQNISRNHLKRPLIMHIILFSRPNRNLLETKVTVFNIFHLTHWRPSMSAQNLPVAPFPTPTATTTTVLIIIRARFQHLNLAYEILHNVVPSYVSYTLHLLYLHCLYPVSSHTNLLSISQRATLLPLFSPLLGMNFTHLPTWWAQDSVPPNRSLIPGLGYVPMPQCSHSPCNFVMVLMTLPVYLVISPTTRTSLRQGLHLIHCGISKRAQYLNVASKCGKLASKMTPNNHSLWVFMPLCNLSHWVWAGCCDSLLMT